MNAGAGRSWHDLREGKALEGAELAQRLARRIEFLTWQDRARVIDEFLWSQATDRLTSDEVTAVVNRQPTAAAQAALDHYLATCRTVISLTLERLAEPAGDSVEAALTHRLSLDPSLRAQAEDRLQQLPRGDIQNMLVSLPGFAFLGLALSPSDSSDSFAARDAFRRAMLGDSG